MVVGARAGHRPGDPASAGEGEESDGHDSVDHSGGHHHSASRATGTARVYACGWPGVLRGSGRDGRHSHGDTRAVARRELAHAPAYLHQPTGPGWTTAPGSRGT